jgi:CBS domain-containing protein
MQIKDVMTRDAEVIRPGATLQEAAETMRLLNVGSLPVCDGERLVGMLTDRDLTVRGTAEGVNPWQTRVEVVMTPGVVYCFEDQDLAEAARVMRENGVRRLPVLSRAKRLVGIISLDDIAVDAGDELLAGEVVRGAAQPTERKQ